MEKQTFDGINNRREFKPFYQIKLPPDHTYFAFVRFTWNKKLLKRHFKEFSVHFNAFLFRWLIPHTLKRLKTIENSVLRSFFTVHGKTERQTGPLLSVFTVQMWTMRSALTQISVLVVVITNLGFGACSFVTMWTKGGLPGKKFLIENTYVWKGPQMILHSSGNWMDFD